MAGLTVAIIFDVQYTLQQDKLSYADSAGVISAIPNQLTFRLVFKLK